MAKLRVQATFVQQVVLKALDPLPKEVKVLDMDVLHWLEREADSGEPVTRAISTVVLPTNQGEALLVITEVVEYMPKE